ncbi:segregation and condensation protein A [Streptomyces mexicanus]|uniref:segregation and condensation protein A n=1 Tax=Streptomyces mexicanus TaxID=178566 RepID=UPI0031EF2C97
MTSNDVPASAPGRRRPLGRGPGAAAARTEPPAPPRSSEPRPDTAGAGPDARPVPQAGTEPAAGPGPSPRTDPSPPDDRAAPTPPGEFPAEPGPGVSFEPGPAPERTHGEQEPGRRVAVGTRPVPTGEARPEPEPIAEPGPEPEPVAAPQPGSADAGDDGVFTVRLANFEGPFDLLLQLISKHKLDVTEVALSKVTDEFMAHIRAMGPDWDLDRTTEFLVVAATLLDLKAARLLPAAEVEDEADLALLEARDLLFARLLQYRAYKQIAEIFDRRLHDEARRHPRTVGLEPHHADLLPEVVLSIGLEGFAKLAVKAMQPKPEPQVYVDHIHAPLVSVQEQAGIVVARLRELGEATFRTLVADTDDTLTVVARFLALLELYREKAVALEQETALGELTVRWTGGDGDEAPTVTDEFDRPPEERRDEAGDRGEAKEKKA